MRQFLHPSRPLWRALPIAALVFALSAHAASAENLFDLLFGGFKAPEPAAAVPATPDAMDPSGKPVGVASSGRNSGFCVRTCDGRYFPVVSRGGSTPAQMCQAFCPASATRVYFGGSIDSAVSANGERYNDLPNAYSYRKALKADCTCNGRDPAGLAPVDLSLDTTLRPGDVVATSDGLVAYTGVRLGMDQAPDFTPVNSYPGLTADIRARLGELKVAPTAADIPDETPPDIAQGAIMPVAPREPAAPPSKQRRAALN